jgi:hypothetical protein
MCRSVCYDDAEVTAPAICREAISGMLRATTAELASRNDQYHSNSLCSRYEHMVHKAVNVEERRELFHLKEMTLSSR